MKKKLAILILGIFAPLALSSAAPAPASALFESSKQQACDGASLSDSGGDCTDDRGANRVEEVIQTVIDILTIIIGIAAVIMIIVNGFRFITANGDSGAITSARNGIIYAIVGLIIVAMAQAIVRFVVGKL